MKILVVEDDTETRDFLQSSLKEHGFRVDVAHDGELGFQLAQTIPYDCILLDYVLPKKDGFIFCKELRDSAIHTPILITSVVTEIESKVHALEIGADDYITKPFSFPEVLARIHALIRRPKVVEKDVLAIGPLTLDTENQTALLYEKEIYLTRKEFALLEYLLKQKGKIVARSRIMEHVWDKELNPFSNTIEVHILNIRKKLESTKFKFIKNVPGRGYKIELKTL